MKPNKFTYVSLTPIVVATILLATSCSAGKNTARSRWWQAFNTRYNVYYNGSTAYVDGSLEKESGNRDNFTELIPLYTVANKNSRELGKSNFDRAIAKCEKAIQLHSIKRRPTWNKKRRKTEQDIEWLNRREYNPFLWKAWLLMGRSQFHKADFEQAAATFAYMSRLYRTQAPIYAKARAWLAKTYIEQGWMYDAEDVIRNMQRDSIDWRAVKEWDYTYADYYIHTNEYAKAIPYLQKVIRHEMRRKQRAREWFLMGQLQAILGHTKEAYRAFRKAASLHASYELDFNARIAMTEVAAQGQGRKMIGRLRRMALSDNNKDYLDQVFYAIGNIYLAQRDTINAIRAYENGNQKATRSGIEKGVLLLRLGNLYWNKELFGDARRCYNEALGLLDKDRADYEQLSRRSKMLDELVPHLEAVHLQDSLQLLARLPEKDRNAAIDRVIAALKKKEKEERDAQAEANAQQTLARNGRTAPSIPSLPAPRQSKEANLWYFYNPQAVSQGKAAFERQWGKRENIDNWQRINPTVVSLDPLPNELSQAQRDSIFEVDSRRDSLKKAMQTEGNDPHQREYYLSQIPFTPEQMQASNELLTDGLYHSGILFKDQLNHLPLAEKALRRLSDRFPQFSHMADVYYHLFLLYSRMGRPETASGYIDRLKKEFPQSEWTELLTNPNYTLLARSGPQLEDSLYAATYDAFQAGRYAEVKNNTQLSSTTFRQGANRDKFLFISALSLLNDGHADGCLSQLQTLIEQYPQSSLSTMAGMVINGVRSGRTLRGGRFDVGNIWQRRTLANATVDSTAARHFSADRISPFVFLIAYPSDSLNEHQLLFLLARYNFTHYLVRNFDIALETVGPLRQMRVSGFRNYDEALQYARELHRQTAIMQLATAGRTLIISEFNLSLLGRQLSYDDYDRFYTHHFLPLKVSTLPLLSEPTEIVTPQELSPPAAEEKKKDTSKQESEDDDEYYDVEGF